MPEPREAADRITAGRNRSGNAIVKARFVRLDVSEAPDGVETATAVTDNLHGVSMSAIVDGANGDVMLTGLARVEAGAAVVVGDRVNSDGQGRGIPASAGAGVANGGVAKTAAAQAGDIFECELAGPGSLFSA